MTLCKKVSQRIAVLKKIKRNLPLAERKLYFNTLIEPIMLYGLCAWCTASEENVNRVSKLQKRAARIILDAKIRERSKLPFRRLNWLLRKEESNLKRTSLIFRRIKEELPQVYNGTYKQLWKSTTVVCTYVWFLTAPNISLHGLHKGFSSGLLCPSFLSGLFL